MIVIMNNEKRDKYLDLAREQKKSVEHEVDGDTNCNWCTQSNPQKFGKTTRRFRNQRTSGDHLVHNIIKI